MEHVPGKYITPSAEEEYNITRMTNTRTQDLTTGPILPLLITFTIPLVLGNLLELTYNAVDSMIIGRFVGTNALAAVGTSNPLMTPDPSFINGICPWSRYPRSQLRIRSQTSRHPETPGFFRLRRRRRLFDSVRPCLHCAGRPDPAASAGG